MRPRQKEIPIGPASIAVKALREHLGMTQQRFAQEVGIAINSIARYETGRTPGARILLKLETLAGNSDRGDLVREFKRELAAQMGIALPKGGISFRGDNEWVDALSWMMLQPKVFKKELRLIQKILARAVKEVHAFQAGRMPERIEKVFDRAAKKVRYQEGRIAEILGTPERKSETKS